MRSSIQKARGGTLLLFVLCGVFVPPAHAGVHVATGTVNGGQVVTVTIDSPAISGPGYASYVDLRYHSVGPNGYADDHQLKVTNAPGAAAEDVDARDSGCRDDGVVVACPLGPGGSVVVQGGPGRDAVGLELPAFLRTHIDLGPGPSDVYEAGASGDPGVQGLSADTIVVSSDVAYLRLWGGDDSATVAPGARANFLGGEGNDTFTGAELNDSFNGGGGNDVAHTGAGADNLVGGDGSDYLDPGPGADIVDYGRATGADRVMLRDGETDEARCDGGADPQTTVVADYFDTFTCATPVHTDLSPDTDPPTVKVLPSSHSLKRFRTSGLPVRVRCSEACVVTAELQLSAATARRLRLPRVLAHVESPLPAFNPAHASPAVTLKRAAGAAHSLAKLTHLTVTLHVTARDSAGNPGKPVRSKLALRY